MVNMSHVETKSDNKFWFKVTQGNKGKNIYLISDSFWEWISLEKKKCKTYGSSTKLIETIKEMCNREVSSRAIIGWLYNKRKPIIIDNKEIDDWNNVRNGCVHGLKYICPLCRINTSKIDSCPVNLLWKTHEKGKVYVYYKYWCELSKLLTKGKSIGITHLAISKFLNIDQRLLRRWSYDNKPPKVYTEDEYVFTATNAYWLGLFLSDGHIRNNGSRLSYTYQSGSNNPFQGYWYPQVLQKLPIFSHKIKRSLTYLTKDDGNICFKTNLSGISPIFCQMLEKENIIKGVNNSPTTGFRKNISQNLVINNKFHNELFQGLFDGDGHFNITKEHGITIALSLDPNIDYVPLINNLPLVPTKYRTLKDVSSNCAKGKENKLADVVFAPKSLNYLDSMFTERHIVDQLEFFMEAAHNSIRPDKVYKLINIVNRICSKEYGEYRNCLEIQKQIKKEAIKRGLKERIEALKRRYPIRNGFYQPFMPKWLEQFGSSSTIISEFWDFFLNEEFLIKKDFRNKPIIDFCRI